MSFAYLVYASAWLKRYHPAAFCAALLNAQPMGFYSPRVNERDRPTFAMSPYPFIGMGVQPRNSRMRSASGRIDEAQLRRVHRRDRVNGLLHEYEHAA